MITLAWEGIFWNFHFFSAKILYTCLLKKWFQSIKNIIITVVGGGPSSNVSTKIVF